MSGMPDFSKRPRFLPSLASIGRRLPQSFVSAHMVAVLEFARHMQWLVPPAQIDGRSFAITIEDLGLRCCFSCMQGRFRPQWQVNGMQARMDLELGANLADFANLANGSVDADTLFFQRRLKISGDTDLGLIVKNWLDATERPAWLART
jgi:predicted lipid carrier protein YhbT